MSELSHNGVKGMKWGHRKKDASPQERLASIDKEILRLDRENNKLRRRLPAGVVLGGASANSYGAKKVMKLKKITVTDPQGGKHTKLVETDKTPTVALEDRLGVNRKIAARSAAHYASGYLVAGALLAAPSVAKKLAPDLMSDKKAGQYITQGSRVLAGLQAMQTTMTLVGIASAHHDAQRDTKRALLVKERAALRKQIK